MVYSLVSVYVLCAVPRMFSLNQIGQPGTLALFILPYLMACIFFAMTVSIAIRNRETCMLIFVFTSVPLLFISGISWPGAAISYAVLLFNRSDESKLKKRSHTAVLEIFLLYIPVYFRH